MSGPQLGIRCILCKRGNFVTLVDRGTGEVFCVRAIGAPVSTHTIQDWLVMEQIQSLSNAPAPPAGAPLSPFKPFKYQRVGPIKFKFNEEAFNREYCGTFNAGPKLDDKFPHKSVRCGAKAYVGFTSVEHADAALDKACR